MKIIITGANGMLGSALCQLYNDKYIVYALHRDEKCLSVCKEDYSLDLRHVASVNKIINEIEPDLLIHCAGLTNIESCEQNPDLAVSLNVSTIENIARSCSDKTKLIYVSTDQVYGDTEDYSETNQLLKPVNNYGKSKLYGEQKLQNISSNYLILRTNIFGWNVKRARVSSAEWMYFTMKQGKEINLFTDYIFFIATGSIRYR